MALPYSLKVAANFAPRSGCCSARLLERVPPRVTALPFCPMAQLRGYRLFLALCKTSLWWMSPRWGAAALQVPVGALFGAGALMPAVGTLPAMLALLGHAGPQGFCRDGRGAAPAHRAGCPWAQGALARLAGRHCKGRQQDTYAAA